MFSFQDLQFLSELFLLLGNLSLFLGGLGGQIHSGERKNQFRTCFTQECVCWLHHQTTSCHLSGLLEVTFCKFIGCQFYGCFAQRTVCDGQSICVGTWSRPCCNSSSEAMPTDLPVKCTQESLPSCVTLASHWLTSRT